MSSSSYSFNYVTIRIWNSLYCIHCLMTKWFPNQNLFIFTLQLDDNHAKSIHSNNPLRRNNFGLWSWWKNSENDLFILSLTANFILSWDNNIILESNYLRCRSTIKIHRQMWGLIPYMLQVKLFQNRIFFFPLMFVICWLSC